MSVPPSVRAVTEPYATRANLGIAVGLVMTIGGRLWYRSLDDGDDGLLTLALIVGVAGTVAFVYGCVNYALAKGRAGWWGLLGLLSVLGLIVLWLLPDRSDPRMTRRDAAAF